MVEVLLFVREVSLKCNAWRSVVDIDDPTAFKAVFYQEVLHHFVVGMGVNAQAVCAFATPLEGGGRDPLMTAVGSEAMDDIIGSVVRPRAVLYIGIGRVRARNKTKRADNFPSFVLTRQAVGGRYFTPYQMALRITVNPLASVARGVHRAAGGLKDFHQAV